MVHGAGGSGIGAYSSPGVHARSIASVGRQLCHSVCRGSTTALRSCAAATQQRCSCRSIAATLRLPCRSVVAAAQLLCSSSTTAPPQPCSCFTAALPHLCSSCLHLIYRRLRPLLQGCWARPNIDAARRTGSVHNCAARLQAPAYASSRVLPGAPRKKLLQAGRATPSTGVARLCASAHGKPTPAPACFLDSATTAAASAPGSDHGRCRKPARCPPPPVPHACWHPFQRSSRVLPALSITGAACTTGRHP